MFIKPLNQSVIYPWQDALHRLSIDQRWQEIHSYLSPNEQEKGITIQRLWQILDLAWVEMEASSSDRELSQFLHNYYQHPV